MKAVSVYLKQKLKEQFVMFLRKSCHVLAVGVLEITTIFKREMRALAGQLLFKERGISGGWRSGQKTLDVLSKLCVKTLFISEDFHY